MSEPSDNVKGRLSELARVQKERHLTEAELWEVADLLRAAGRESSAREAEAAAMRQRARDALRTPDATFSVGDEAGQLGERFCRTCGKAISAQEASDYYDHCREHAPK